MIALWIRHADQPPVAVETPEPLSVLLLPAPAVRVPKLPATAPDKRKDARSPRPSALAPPKSPAPPATPVAPVAVQAEAPAPPAAAQILEDSRHDIGNIGRELRGQDGVSPLRARPAPPVLTPSGKWSRFAQQLEDAHIERSPNIVTEEYTAPDGRVLYRTRQGNKVICRQSGSPGPPATWRSEEAVRAGAGSKSTLGVGNSAGNVLCPESDRDWNKL
ncbi:hypothetical protein [Massilia terrae]|uniref:Ig-like domain-containing protein n=1 Tax=Massilia terrae TaxID=1811224 RepID=A0ABT2CUQ3_9BURK|nr:hypothetical protein [Massilia terrae]MCS0657697.1 hypothetical protein [Massilia terrae]